MDCIPWSRRVGQDWAIFTSLHSSLKSTVVPAASPLLLHFLLEAWAWNTDTALQYSIRSLPLLQLHGLWSARLLCPSALPGKNTGMGYRFLLRGIFPTQRLNLCLPHWQADSLPLSHQGSPLYTVKYTKAQPLGEDALMWQCLPDKWTNVHEWTYKHTVTSLKVHNLKIPM